MDKFPIARLEYQVNQLLVGISLGNLCVSVYLKDMQILKYIHLRICPMMSNGYRGFGMIEDTSDFQR